MTAAPASQINPPRRRPPDPLRRAWAWLLALSLGSTVLAILQGRGIVQGAGLTVCGAFIFALACAKARLILRWYLGLAAAPRWQRGFDLVLGLYAALMLGLYLAA